MVVVGEQVEQLPTGHHLLPERHRTVLGDHHLGRSANRLDPGAELLGVADRRRQGHEGDRVGQVDDHLLPDRTTEPVGEVVHLVHDDERQVEQGARAGVEHVAQHLGGHDDHGSLTVDGVVAGEQTDVLLAVALHEVAVLLVRQRLDGRGVEALAPGPERQLDGELADHRLARPGGGGHEHGLALRERLAGAHLEGIEPEGVAVAELGDHGLGGLVAELLPRPPLGVAVGRTGHVVQATGAGVPAPAARPVRRWR